MSDTWQGEGWWVASDGKWYPPESHPDAAPAQSATAQSAPAAPAPAPPAPARPAAPASRWLGRSDRPPAPATATLAESPGTPTAPPPSSTRWSKPPAATAPGPPTMVAPVSYRLLDTPVRRPPPQRPVAIWVFISIGIVVVTVVIAFLSLGGTGGVPGDKSGTLDIIYPSTGRPSFSGTIDGTALTGKVTGSSFSSTPDRTLPGTSQTLPGETTQSLTYKGHYGGNAFALYLSLTSSNLGIDQQDEWEVTGTDGSSPVHGEATFDGPTNINPTPQVSFSGVIGTQSVLGNATLTRRRGAIEVTLNFVDLP